MSKQTLFYKDALNLHIEKLLNEISNDDQQILQIKYKPCQVKFDIKITRNLDGYYFESYEGNFCNRLSYDEVIKELNSYCNGEIITDIIIKSGKGKNLIKNIIF